MTEHVLSAAATAATPPAHGSAKMGRLAMASSIGTTLEWYDFTVYNIMAALVFNAVFFPSFDPLTGTILAFSTYAVGYISRPLGGVVFGHLGDRLGRRFVLVATLVIMGVSTGLMGLLPTYATIGLLAPMLLLVLRILQGAAVGGEVPGAWVFVSEHVPKRHIGYACGTLTAGLTAGILLGSLVATGINAIFDPQELLAHGWRVPFVLGGIFGVGSMYLRRWLHETPVFAELQQRKALAAEMPLKAVVRDHRGAVLISVLLTWMLSAGIVVVILLTPTYLQTLFGFDARTALVANSAATLFLSIGCVVAGVLADRIGARLTLSIGGALLAATAYLLYTTIGTRPELLLPLYALAGFFVGTIGAVPYVLVHAFPAQVRFSGLSFSYNVSYAIFGGLTPVIVSLMLKTDKLAPAHYVVGVCVMGIITALFVRKREA